MAQEQNLRKTPDLKELDLDNELAKLGIDKKDFDLRNQAERISKAFGMKSDILVTNQIVDGKKISNKMIKMDNPKIVVSICLVLIMCLLATDIYAQRGISVVFAEAINELINIFRSFVPLFMYMQEQWGYIYSLMHTMSCINKYPNAE